MAPRFLENMSNPDFAPIPAAGIQQRSTNMTKPRICVVSKSECEWYLKVLYTVILFKTRLLIPC